MSKRIRRNNSIHISLGLWLRHAETTVARLLSRASKSLLVDALSVMGNSAAVLLRTEVCGSLSSSLAGDCCDQHSSYRLLFKRGLTPYCSSRIERLRIYPASRCDSTLLLQHMASPRGKDLTYRWNQPSTLL